MQSPLSTREFWRTKDETFRAAVLLNLERRAPSLFLGVTTFNLAKRDLADLPLRIAVELILAYRYHQYFGTDPFPFRVTVHEEHRAVPCSH